MRAGTDGWVWVGGGRKRHMYGTCTGRAPTKGLGAVHDYGERTLNMLRMVVTLDVSKLSGLLNALASYRVIRRANDAG